MNHSDLWQQGLAQLELDYSDVQLQQLQNYVALLLRWNKTYNLTSVRNERDMVIRHIFDSLSVNPYLQKTACLDVGSGGGLPGIPLAIMNPDIEFTLLDTNGKKTRFIQQAVIQLDLKNINVEQARIEAFKSREPFLQIISRAFASIEDFISGCEHLLADSGKLLAMKGQFPEQELNALSDGFVVDVVHDLAVPFLDEDRVLIEIAGA